MSSDVQLLVSVIIPTYNGGSTLGEQLAALQAQRYTGPWELIVVDNRSTDNTAEVVARYSAALPQLRLVAALERQGRAYAVNVGVRAAHGALLLFCDSDDVAAPGWLTAMAEALRQHAFVAGAMDLERLNPPNTLRPDPRSGTRHKALGFLPYAVGANMGLTRAAFEAVGGCEERSAKCEDVDLSWRLQLAGYQLADAPEAVIAYRARADLGGAFRQIAAYAAAHVWLYRRFQPHGMPGSNARHALERYGRIIGGLPRLLRRRWRGRVGWLIDLATAWGRLLGSIRYRRLYL